MTASWTTLAVIFSTLFISARVNGQAASTPANTGFHWLAFPDIAKFKVLGLHWFDQNSPKLWRMPAREMNSLPKGRMVKN